MLNQNVHILGLECLLPPPPPPPPPPKISANESAPPPPPPPQSGLQTPIPPHVGPFGSPMAPAPYFQGLLPPVNTHSASAPWWIPNDADSVDVYSHWYATSYKQAPPVTAAVPPTPVPVPDKTKAKNKFLKRKSETIDPRVDAGKNSFISSI